MLLSLFERLAFFFAKKKRESANTSGGERRDFKRMGGLGVGGGSIPSEQQIATRLIGASGESGDVNRLESLIYPRFLFTQSVKGSDFKGHAAPRPSGTTVLAVVGPLLPPPLFLLPWPPRSSSSSLTLPLPASRH